MKLLSRIALLIGVLVGRSSFAATFYVATTGDGVKLIRPKMKATHFTSKEIRETIAKVVQPSSVKK